MNVKQKQLWNEIVKNSSKYQQSLDPLSRKQVGVYYTDFDLTESMMEMLFLKMDSEFKRNIFSKTFFEPCVGVGNFVFSYLKYIHEHYKYSYSDVKTLFSNIYVCDSDSSSLRIFKEQLGKFSKIFFNVEIDEDIMLNNIGDGLIFDIDSKSSALVEPRDYFGISSFDIVMTNPPYKGFRAESKHYSDKLAYEEDKRYYEVLKAEIKKRFQYQGKNSPNLYKLFTEEILTKYLKKNGYAYLLLPHSILKDKSSTELRKYFLTNSNILHICNVDEHTKYVDAKQALSALLVKNNKETGEFSVINHFGTSKENKLNVDGKRVLGNINHSIIALSKGKIDLLDKMNSCKKIGDLSFIQNLRGELDLTINKKNILSEGHYPLLRGRNLSEFSLKNLPEREFASEEFVLNSKKKEYITQNRIACPQISNMNASKRLFFSYVPANYVLGNSCNFIQVLQNEDGVDLYFLLGLLNSDLYDWYFGVFSSNNHINNYEIDNFPIPNISTERKRELSSVVKKGIYGDLKKLLSEVNSRVNTYFSEDEDCEVDNINNNCFNDMILAFPTLNEEKVKNFVLNKISINELVGEEEFSPFDLKVIDAIKEKYELIDRNEVLNHSSFKLSDLDMEMVKSVSPGGNWKEIPLEVAKKSKRLMRIRETGGRTTLYGRLDYAKPSYTITTYFNRPGNGTNIHPKYNRVLSVREAARIQSFPDDYFFYGNKKNKLNQIGNAVPPLMAYQIAKSIKKQVGVGTSLDLFNGAGGMTTGFKMAGYHSALMNDIDEAALVTAKLNYPGTKAFLGDLTEETNRNYIINHSINSNVDIINGGPPCQGFSMAGFRNPEDPRSKLIYDYVEVLKSVSPKAFVFENVQGLLSHNNGRTFKDLLGMFSKIGYETEARLLDFSDYGIPQKRKRVIIIGVRKELNIQPVNLFPKALTVDKKSKISVKDAIFDLENIPLDDKSFYVNVEESSFSKVLKNKMSVEDYLSDLDNKSNSDSKLENIQLSLFAY